MQDLDPRIIRVGIEIDGQLRTYEGLDITASGTKYANPLQNECEIKISNLSREVRDYLLTETSPLNQRKVRKSIILEAGRVSYGTSVLFRGDITSVVGGQPPDITLTIKAMTGNWDKGNVVSNSQPGQAQLSKISEQAAKDMGLKLDFQAKDKSIANYSHTGAAIKQVDRIGTAGAVSAYIDDDRLVVKDIDMPLTGRTRVLSLDTGMIGAPEFTEQGIKVKFLYDGQTALGGALDITSVMNPAANGRYQIYKLQFEVASRNTAFYWIAEAKRI